MVHLERSIDAITALLAIWKAGAAYLPVEPAVPDSRVAGFAKETGCATVLTSERDLHRFAGVAGHRGHRGRRCRLPSTPHRK